MSDERITDRPAPVPPPAAHDPQGPRSEVITQVIAGAVVGGFAGFFFTRGFGGLPSLFLALCGAALGAIVAYTLAVSRWARGVRVLDESLPSGERPRLAALPRSEAIATRPVPNFRPRVDRVGGHRHAITGLALSPDAAQLASCDDEGAVIVHDLTTGFEVWAARDFGHGAVDAAYSPDGRLLAVAGHEARARNREYVRSAVRVYDALDGRELRRIELHTPLGAVAFLPDRRLLIGLSVRLGLWELETPAEQRTIPSFPFSYINPSDVACLTVRGDIAVVGCLHTQKARVLAIERGEEVLSFSGHYRYAALVRVGSVLAVAVSPSGHHVVSGGLDGYARVWTLRSGKQLQRFGGHWGLLGWHGVTGVGWLSDDEAVSSGEDGTLRRWDTRTGAELARFDHRRCILRLSVVGRTAVTGASDGSIRVWAV